MAQLCQQAPLAVAALYVRKHPKHYKNHPLCAGRAASFAGVRGENGQKPGLTETPSCKALITRQTGGQVVCKRSKLNCGRQAGSDRLGC